MKRTLIALFLVCLSAPIRADVIVFNDTFDRSITQENNISASTDGMSGTASPITYVEQGDLLTGNDGLVNIENNRLHVADGSNMGVFYPELNFADGTSGAAVLSAGGMRVGLTIVSNDGTATDLGRWVGFGVGNSLSECRAANLDHNGPGFRGQDYSGSQPGSSDIWVDWSPYGGGTLHIYKNGPAGAGGDSVNLPVGALTGSDRLELELLIGDFNAGTTVYANVLWNGTVVHSTTFQWDHTNQNYIGFSTRQSNEGFTVDDFTVTAVSPQIDPTIGSFSALPNSVSSKAAAAPIELTFSLAQLKAGTTYAVSADKAVTFPDHNQTGTAVEGSTSLAALVNGTLGNVVFTLTLYQNAQPVATAQTQIDAISMPDPDAPNVIVILLDDTGWSDIGCYGSEIQTPHIDSLAAGGVRFRNFYQAARCAPTRIALLSGLYTQQGAASPGQALPPLRTDNNVTIAEVLGSDGYRTYMTGKWHLGQKAEGRDPLSRGFMHVFGQGTNVDGSNTSNAFGYWQEGNYNLVSTGNEIPKRQYGSQGIQFHYADAVGDYSVDFIDHHVRKGDGRPFFLYMPFNAAHWPVCAPAELANKYTDVGDPNPDDVDVCLYEEGWDVMRARKYQRQLDMGVIDSRYVLSPKGDHPTPPIAIPDWDTLGTNRRMDLARRQALYAAMLDQADQNIGKVIDKLTQEGLLNNTMIFFCCDNGANYEGGLYGNTNDPAGIVWDPDHLDSMGQPENAENTGYPRVNQGGGWANMSNSPFRLFKHFTHDGGIRTSAILYWPAKTDPSIRGTWTEERGHLIDVMATVIDATGADYPTTFNGHSVLPREGKSLLPVLEGKTLPARDIGVEHESNRAFFRGTYKFTTKNFSLSDGSSPAHELELYNLQDDPTEMNNLAAAEPDVLAEMVKGWNAWATRVGVPSARLVTLLPPDPNLPDPDFADALIQDTFARPNNTDINADADGMSGMLAPMTYVESYEGSGTAESIQILNGRLQMGTDIGMSTLYLDHNFIDPAIPAEGGFTVMLDILDINGGDGPDRFGGFGVGLTRQEAADAGDIANAATLRPYLSGGSAVPDFYIDLAKDGVLRAWSDGALLSETPVVYTYGRIRVDFLLPDFARDNTVIARIFFNEMQKDMVSFTWDYTGQNYIALSARATNYVQMDNLVVMPYPSDVSVSADVTGEGAVNLDDFALIAAQWVNGYSIPCPSADLTGDCLVDIRDLTVLTSAWLAE